MRTVVCVMLANGRPDMVRRAVASFHAQEYDRRKLLIWNTGRAGACEEYEQWETGNVAVVHSEPASIGVLRNEANAAALRVWPGVDILAHWDSDDWSHPRRLSECVELLENTRADIVGYRECVFWDSRNLSDVSPAGALGDSRRVNEAWIYRTGNPGAPIGSSMVYGRATWERKPFPPQHAGEDTLWLLGGRFKVHAVPSTWQPSGLPHEPRMICAIHGGNTSSRIMPRAIEWSREPRLDPYCSERMK